ncbi:hypothetical protein HDU88_004776 [Geranomyces variabilis]|nr:hypothetical protein HDU88_004776 [Geranomyces variabilis]
MMTKLGHLAGLGHIIKIQDAYYAHLHFESLYDAAVFAHPYLPRDIFVDGVACTIKPSYEGGQPIKYAYAFVVTIQAPTIVRETLEVEVEHHRTIIITADVEGQAAGNLIFSNEALRLSIVLALPSMVDDNGAAEIDFRDGCVIVEFPKAGPPRKKVRLMPKDICANVATASPPLHHQPIITNHVPELKIGALATEAAQNYPYHEDVHWGHFWTKKRNTAASMLSMEKRKRLGEAWADLGAQECYKTLDAPKLAVTIQDTAGRAYHLFCSKKLFVAYYAGPLTVMSEAPAAEDPRTMIERVFSEWLGLGFGDDVLALLHKYAADPVAPLLMSHAYAGGAIGQQRPLGFRISKDALDVEGCTACLHHLHSIGQSRGKMPTEADSKGLVRQFALLFTMKFWLEAAPDPANPDDRAPTDAELRTFEAAAHAQAQQAQYEQAAAQAQAQAQQQRRKKLTS